MRVLVTGGAGFIGSHVVEALLQAGHEVRVLDNAPTVPPGGVEHLLGDVRDATAVETALRGVDAVCHQAAKVGLGVDLDDAPDYVACNDLGTAVVLAATARAGIGRLVLAGSMVVYGEGSYGCPRDGAVGAPPRSERDLAAGRFEPRCPRCAEALVPGLVHEDAPADPRNVYATTKLAQENLAAAFARTTGAAALSLRYHNVYGPRMPRDTPYAGVASIFRSALARGEAPQVFEDGGQRRDFVHVRDVATANLAALEATDRAELAGRLRPYNVGSGSPRTVGEMANALASACNGPTPVITGRYRLGDVRHITAASDRIRAELGWRPEITFEDGMTEFADEASALATP